MKDPPPFSKGSRQTRFGNFDVSDQIWLGDDGQLDPYALLSEAGWQVESPLEIILHSIAEAHAQIEDLADTRRRTSSAMALLLGQPKKGRKPVEDEDLLLEVGRRYWREWLVHREKTALRPIVASVLASLPPDDPRLQLPADERSRAVRLEAKFRKRRDLILARVTLSEAWESRDSARIIRRVLGDLETLGVAISGPRFRRG